MERYTIFSFVCVLTRVILNADFYAEAPIDWDLLPSDSDEGDTLHS